MHYQAEGLPKAQVGLCIDAILRAVSGLTGWGVRINRGGDRGLYSVAFAKWLANVQKNAPSLW